MVDENEENKTSLEDEDDTSSKVLRIVKKIFYISLLILLCVIITGVIYICSQLNSVEKYQTPNVNSSLNITEKII